MEERQASALKQMEAGIVADILRGWLRHNRAVQQRARALPADERGQGMTDDMREARVEQDARTIDLETLRVWEQSILGVLSVIERLDQPTSDDPVVVSVVVHTEEMPGEDTDDDDLAARVAQLERENDQLRSLVSLVAELTSSEVERRSAVSRTAQS